MSLIVGKLQEYEIYFKPKSYYERDSKSFLDSYSNFNRFDPGAPCVVAELRNKETKCVRVYASTLSLFVDSVLQFKWSIINCRLTPIRLPKIDPKLLVKTLLLSH